MKVHILTPVTEKSIEELITNSPMSPIANYLLLNLISLSSEEMFDELFLINEYPDMSRKDVMDGYEEIMNQGYLKRVVDGSITHCYISLDGEINMALFN